ncbi:hypothetical protein M3Y97_01043400 [Aphelenchoides bicaudatus]|nr:hypothetical protein M3Y97_01043400 [Aphelenchoides bicaudatus]
MVSTINIEHLQSSNAFINAYLSVTEQLMPHETFRCVEVLNNIVKLLLQFCQNGNVLEELCVLQVVRDTIPSSCIFLQIYVDSNFDSLGTVIQDQVNRGVIAFNRIPTILFIELNRSLIKWDKYRGQFSFETTLELAESSTQDEKQLELFGFVMTSSFYPNSGLSIHEHNWAVVRHQNKAIIFDDDRQVQLMPLDEAIFYGSYIGSGAKAQNDFEYMCDAGSAVLLVYVKKEIAMNEIVLTARVPPPVYVHSEFSGIVGQRVEQARLHRLDPTAHKRPPPLGNAVRVQEAWRLHREDPIANPRPELGGIVGQRVEQARLHRLDPTANPRPEQGGIYRRRVEPEQVHHLDPTANPRPEQGGIYRRRVEPEQVHHLDPTANPRPEQGGIYRRRVEPEQVHREDPIANPRPELGGIYRRRVEPEQVHREDPIANPRPELGGIYRRRVEPEQVRREDPPVHVHPLRGNALRVQEVWRLHREDPIANPRPELGGIVGQRVEQARLHRLDPTAHKRLPELGIIAQRRQQQLDFAHQANNLRVSGNYDINEATSYIRSIRHPSDRFKLFKFGNFFQA